MSIKNRLEKLETHNGQGRAPRLSLAELERRVNFVLAYPQAVSAEVYARIVEIVNKCKQKQVSHE